MSENINYLCKITRWSFHMKLTHNFKNVCWWVLLPTRAGRRDSFLPGQREASVSLRRVLQAQHTLLVSISTEPDSSKLHKNTSDSSSGSNYS